LVFVPFCKGGEVRKGGLLNLNLNLNLNLDINPDLDLDLNLSLLGGVRYCLACAQRPIPGQPLKARV
jgi:hypothetical protein